MTAPCHVILSLSENANLTYKPRTPGAPTARRHHSPSSPCVSLVNHGQGRLLWRVGDACRTGRIDLDGDGHRRGAVACWCQSPGAARRGLPPAGCGACSSSASAPTVPVWPRSRFVRGGFGLSVAVRVALARLPACRKLGKDVCLRLLSRDEP